MSDEKRKTIKDFVSQNIPWIIATLLSVVNLYLANILTPIKENINTIASAQENLAEDVKTINKEGSIHSQFNAMRVENVEGDITEIKVLLEKIDAKIDNIKN